MKLDNVVCGKIKGKFKVEMCDNNKCFNVYILLNSTKLKLKKYNWENLINISRWNRKEIHYLFEISDINICAGKIEFQWMSTNWGS